MTILLLTYLIFQIGYDHWGDASAMSSVIYYAFQYAWIAATAIVTKSQRRTVHYLIAVIFAGLSVNELLCLNLNEKVYFEHISDGRPAVALTIIGLGLFIIYEIMQWKRKSV